MANVSNIPLQRNPREQQYDCGAPRVASAAASALAFALVIIAICAACHVGSLGQMSNAKTISYWVGGAAGLLYLAAFILSAIDEFKTSPSNEPATSQEEENNVNDTRQSNKSSKTKQNSYGTKTSVATKLDKQLYHAYVSQREIINGKTLWGEKKKSNLEFYPFDDFDLSKFQNHLKTPTLIGGFTLLANNNRNTEDVSFRTLQILEPNGNIKYTYNFEAVFDAQNDEGLLTNYLKENFPQKLLKELAKIQNQDDDTITNLLTNLFREVHEEVKAKITKGKFGASLTCTLRTNEKIFIANAGNCRTVFLSIESGCFALSEDAVSENKRFHKGVELKSDPEELAVALYIPEDDYNKYYRKPPLVSGHKTPALRGIGYEGIPAKPKITRLKKDAKSEILKNSSGEVIGISLGYKKGDHLILASDGFWNVLSLNNVYNQVARMNKEGNTAREIAIKLAACAEGNQPTHLKDHTSVVVVQL